MYCSKFKLLTVNLVKILDILKIYKKYVKKHQNKTVSDFGLSDKKIRRDFDFVYKKYFN